MLPTNALNRAYYEGPVPSFLAADDSYVLGELVRYHGHAVDPLQRKAWLAQIEHLKAVLADFSRGHIFFEFSIPRMGKRADVVLLIGGVVFVLEYKVGETSYPSYAVEQNTQ